MFQDRPEHLARCFGGLAIVHLGDFSGLDLSDDSDPGPFLVKPRMGYIVAADSFKTIYVEHSSLAQA